MTDVFDMPVRRRKTRAEMDADLTRARVEMDRRYEPIRRMRDQVARKYWIPAEEPHPLVRRYRAIMAESVGRSYIR